VAYSCSFSGVSHWMDWCFTGNDGKAACRCRVGILSTQLSLATRNNRS